MHPIASWDPTRGAGSIYLPTGTAHHPRLPGSWIYKIKTAAQGTRVWKTFPFILFSSIELGLVRRVLAVFLPLFVTFDSCGRICCVSFLPCSSIAIASLPFPYPPSSVFLASSCLHDSQLQSKRAVGILVMNGVPTWAQGMYRRLLLYMDPKKKLILTVYHTDDHVVISDLSGQVSQIDNAELRKAFRDQDTWTAGSRRRLRRS